MIPDNYKPIKQIGNGKTTSFSFDFPILSENFIKVYREKDGVQELVDPSEYVWGYIPVEGEEEPAEDVTPDNVITFYEAPEDGVVIVIAREIPLEQTTPYKTSSGFPAVRVEDNFDKLTAITQQLSEVLERCVKVEITDDQDPQELIDDVFEKLDLATEVGEQAIKTAQETKELVEGSKAVIQQETQNAVNTLDAASKDYIEKSRIWAEGEQAEVKPLGGELSSRGFADFAMAIANTPEDVPLDQSKLIAMNIVKGPKGDKGDKGEDGKDGGGLEIGDVAFAVMGIDETQNKRRYLNGQVISQSQFVSFTAKVKNAILLYPSLGATEENWQAEVTNSVNGTCGKFVIDDEAGTIRLPKYPEYVSKEYVEAAVVGNGEQMHFGTTEDNMRPLSTGATTGWRNLALNTPIGEYTLIRLSTDPTKSGLIADLTQATTETIPCKWFIQVATGVEETADVTREIELNNPFSLLDYKWSEYELNNASWLLSNGAFHSGTVYKSVYELLLKIKNGAETKDGVSVKLSTEAYTDTDFVINTADTTFRLPVKVKLASGNAVVGNGMTLGLTNGTANTGLMRLDAGSYFYSTKEAYGTTAKSTPTSVGSSAIGHFGVTTDPTKSGIETSSSGLKLYFYVGETIQDANVIVASGVLTEVANLKARSIVETYVNGTSWYRVYSDGWCEQGGQFTGYNNTITITFLKSWANTNYSIMQGERGRAGGDPYVNGVYYSNFTTTSVAAVLRNDGTNTYMWYACGYIS